MSPRRRAIALETAPPSGDQVIRRGQFSLSANGLTPLGIVPLEEWGSLGPELAIWDRGAAFCLGDWANYGEQEFGEAAAQAIDVSLGISESSMRVYRWVAANVPPANRFIDRGLDFKHHQLVAKLAPRLQKRWLTRALNEGGEPWTTARLKAAMQAGDDLPIVEWLLLVKCGTEAKRSEVMARLEGQGLTCRLIEKRERKPRRKGRAA